MEIAAKKWFQELSEGLDATFGCCVINGTADNVSQAQTAIAQAIEAIQTLPFFSKRVIWLRGITFLADSVTGRAKGTLEALEPLQEALAHHDATSIEIILSAQPADRRRNFVKWLEKNAQSLLFIEAKKDKDLRDWIQKEAQALGLPLNENQVTLLTDSVGNDTRALLQELEKFATYAQGSPVDDAVFSQLLTGLSEGDFFELTESFYSSSGLNKSLKALERYFFHNTEGRPVLLALQNRGRVLISLRALLEAKALSSVSKSSLEAAQVAYGQPFEGLEEKSNCNVFSQNPWYLDTLSRCPFPLKTLITIQHHFFHALSTLPSASQEQKNHLKRLILECLGTG